jgi:hypothetical protein
MMMIATDGLPISIVEKPGFLNLLRVVAPHYQPK